MKWIAVLGISIVLTGSALAAGADDEYLNIYNEILQADSMMENGHPDDAATRYLQAQTDLQKLQAEHPSWNPDIVQYRVDYLADKLHTLGKSVPATNTPPPTASAPSTPTTPSAPAQPAEVTQTAAPDGSALAALEEQNASLQEQVRSLTSANAELQGKLKEALSVQPAAVSPDELAKAEAKIVALQKERDLLAVALDQERASNATAHVTAQTADLEETNSEVYLQIAASLEKAEKQIAQLQVDSAKSERQLAAANKELEWLKSQRATEAGQAAALKASTDADAQKSQDEIARLKAAAADSEQKLAAANKDLESQKATPPPQVEIANGAKQMPEERDELKQLQSDISKDDAEIGRLNDALTDAQKKLASANSELASLKAAGPVQPQPREPAKAIIEERDKLKAELAERTKDLADVEAHHNEELLSAHMALQQATQQRDELEKKLAASQAQPAMVTPPSPAPATAAATNSAPAEKTPSALALEQLQARVAVLEAAPVPYTADELALLKMPPPTKPVDLPSPVAQSSHFHSSDDLPPGSGGLWAEAMHASETGDLDTAEKKYKEVLQQDEKNVYVLAFLANAQFAAGQLADCEKSLKQALAVDPEDPGSLYLLGLLRYRQERLDESLDALSLSAKINPTNAATQNFLGCVLADKGLRTAAETALRKALQCDPDYADAHFNLGVVYAGNQPPSLELARWHYKRALALGHTRSPTLDKLLGENP